MLNITQLQTDLQAQINSLAGTGSADELLALTVALNNLSADKFARVQNYADLPDLTVTPLPSGSLVFVEQFNILMMSVGTQWRGIDGRVYVPLVTVYTWGPNGYGQLGDNTTSSRSSPVTVVGGMTNWSQISSFGNHNLGIVSTGVIYSWGRNNNGQLGDNTTSNRSSPVTVVGGITNWSQVSAGWNHSLGITSTGIAYAWGYNVSGNIGDNTTSDRSSPVTVVGGITNWSQVSGGLRRSLGLTSTGIAYSWGRNNRGQLGDNTTSDRSSPVTVVGGVTNWSQLSTSSQDHSLGLTSTGIAYAWGWNFYGQLGDNTTTSYSSPITVVGGITNWNLLASGYRHSLGVTSTGIAYAWGSNSLGRLGDNTTSNRSSPVTVVGGITNWNKVAGGQVHSLGLTSTGIAYAWGTNSLGQLGDNTTSSRSSPVTVIGGITNWSHISAGTFSLGFTV